jgi:hypothetical protein
MRSPCKQRMRQFRRAPPGRRHRRLVHRENRRHAIWLRSGPAIRTEIQPPRPALVPLVFSERDRKRWCDLAGVSTEVIASTPRLETRQTFRENMLVTHRGISGPAILQISSYWDGKEPIHLDLAPGRDLMPPRCETAAIAIRRTGSRCCGKSCPGASPIAGSKPSSGWQLRSRLRRSRTSTACVGSKPAIDGGLRKSGSHRWRSRYRRTFRETMEARKVPGLFLSGKWSTLPANSAASTFSGPGHPDFAPVMRCTDCATTMRARYGASNYSLQPKSPRLPA